MTAAQDVEYTGNPVSLADNLAVTFSLKRGHFQVEWDPRIPTGSKARQCLKAYTQARDAFVRDLADRTGVTMKVVDI